MESERECERSGPIDFFSGMVQYLFSGAVSLYLVAKQTCCFLEWDSYMFLGMIFYVCLLGFLPGLVG
jgi:hypothetical protein